MVSQITLVLLDGDRAILEHPGLLDPSVAANVREQFDAWWNGVGPHRVAILDAPFRLDDRRTAIPPLAENA